MTDSCPQVGAYGFHSSVYYDGGACAWCGAVMPEDELAALNEMWNQEIQ